jgi:hypothetical protein
LTAIVAAKVRLRNKSSNPGIAGHSLLQTHMHTAMKARRTAAIIKG